MDGIIYIYIYIYIYSEVILVLGESNNNKLKLKLEGPVGVDSNFAKGWILFESSFNTLVDYSFHGTT